MRIVNIITLSVASLALSALASAAELPKAGLPWDHRTEPEVVVVVGHYPALDRTSLIGTGTAASGNLVLPSFQESSSAALPPSARHNWSAAFGTGGAAAFESNPAG